MSINQEILFRRRGAIAMPEVRGTQSNLMIATRDTSVTKEALIATASINISALGYRFSEDFIVSVIDSKLEIFDIGDFLSDVINIVRNAVGDSRNYKPMYPNFPAQLADSDAIELFVNKEIHYLGSFFGLYIMPNYVVDPREPLIPSDVSTLIEIRAAGVTKNGYSYFAAEDEFSSIFTSLLSMKSSWSESEIEDVMWFVENFKESIVGLIPDVISNKENLASFSVVVKNNELFSIFDTTLEMAATATDILRIAVGISGGDTTLRGVGVTPVKFKSQPKVVRRALLQRIENIAGDKADYIIEDMLRYSELWKLLAYSLHAGEYSSRFPLAYQAVSVIRSNGKNPDGTKFSTFGTEVESLIIAASSTLISNDVDANTKIIRKLVSLLSARPGVFGRRLDKIVRSAIDTNIVIDGFEKVSNKLSTVVLWQLINFYENRNLVSGENPQLSRSFMPKGRTSNVLTANGVLPDLDEEKTSSILAILRKAIGDIYSTRDAMGKVFISEDLKGYTVPFGARSGSKALNPVGRGTQVEIDNDSDTIRFFIFWKDGDSRVDIDLSAMFLDDGFNFDGAIAYYNLKESGAVHSGDIVAAPIGAAEYIDIDKKTMLANGRRYIGMIITSYTSQTFSSLPEVFAGVMTVSGDTQRGEIFEARNVKNAFDVTSPSKIAVPMILDLKKNIMIWSDISANDKVMYSINVDNNENVLTRSIKGLVESKFVSLHDIFAANAMRGSIVLDREEADTVIDVNRGRVSINGEVVGTDRIMSEWI